MARRVSGPGLWRVLGAARPRFCGGIKSPKKVIGERSPLPNVKTGVATAIRSLQVSVLYLIATLSILLLCAPRLAVSRMIIA